MRRFLALVHNEILKMLARKRPQLVLLVLVIFLGIATWAQYQRMVTRGTYNVEDDNWRAETRERIERNERRGRQRRIFASVSRYRRFEAMRLRYHLDHDINPNKRTGPLAARAFAVLAGALLLPLLVTVLASDLVTGENRAGTIKMLLTRPVARWKVLSSKLVAMAVFTTLLVAAAAVLSWAISGLAFGWRGWQAPVFTGFSYSATGVDLTGVRMSTLWVDTLACYGLVWFAAITVGIVSVTFSVLFRSSVGAMGTLMAILVAGTLMGQMAEDWEPAKWSFPTNLPLSQYYSGMPPPVSGMTLSHSVGVLAGWAVLALIVGFVVFSRRDVTA